MENAGDGQQSAASIMQELCKLAKEPSIKPLVSPSPNSLQKRPLSPCPIGAFGNGSKSLRITQGRPVVSTQLEHKLHEFLQEKQSEGWIVTNKVLQAKALELAKECNVRGTFKASPKYIKRWKRKYVNKPVRDVPHDYEEKLLGFYNSVMSKRMEGSYSLSNVVSMCEVCVPYTPPVLKLHDRAAEVMLTAAADGTKLPAVMIFKGGSSGKQTGFEGLQVPENVIVQATNNGLITKEQMIWWLDSIVTGEDEDIPPSLLILNRSSKFIYNAEFAQAVDACDCKTCFVPEGCTLLSNPISVGAVRPFLLKVEECRAAHMLIENKLAQSTSEDQKLPSKQDFVNWISTAWNSVTEAEIRNAFLWCGISAPFDGTDSQKVFEHVPYVIRRLQAVNDASVNAGSDDDNDDGLDNSHNDETCASGVPDDEEDTIDAGINKLSPDDDAENDEDLEDGDEEET